MRRTGRTTRRGLTLMEAVAAITVVGIAAPAMLIAVRDAAIRRASVQQQIVARWLLSEKLEEVIADRHSSARGYTWLVNANYTAEASLSGFTAYSRSVNIAETAADLSSAGTGYKTVTVTVSYSDARNGNKSLTLATVVTDYTP